MNSVDNYTCGKSAKGATSGDWVYRFSPKEDMEFSIISWYPIEQMWR